VITIGRMVDADALPVSELLSASYLWVGERDGLSAEQTDFLVSKRGSLECVLRESRAQLYLVARDGEQVVGVVAVSGDEVTKLYVSPERIGKGIGRMLYEAAEVEIRAGGHSRVRLGAFPGAVPFYIRMGLEVVGHKQPASALAPLTMTLMEKRIEDKTA
jgi:GNAT superfamily N-acetyltransferase